MQIHSKKEVENKNQLEISTFGNFMVKRGNELISESSKRSHKIWNLFKYFITHRGKRIPPDILLEIIWEGQDDGNQQALRNLVYRLRRLLNKNKFNDKYCYIIFSQGGYTWDTSSDYWLDAEEFESLYQLAVQTANENPKKAAELYRQGIYLYKGDYLPEHSYYEWVIPIRNYYRRIYLESIFALTELLKKEDRYKEICKICKDALLIEPFEEGIHQIVIEALIEEGETRKALAHYEYITSLFYQELGVKPSPALKKLYRRIKNSEQVIELDLVYIQESLSDRKEAAGAFACDPDTFRFFYKLEGRRMERSGEAVFLGLLTLTNTDYNLPSDKSLKETMELLQRVLKNSLRKGDVISQWNEAQFLLLLPGINSEQAGRVFKRIQDKFQKKCQDDEIILRTKYQPLQLQGKTNKFFGYI